MMNTISKLRVEIDEKIRQNTMWFDAVRQASVFFEEQLQDSVWIEPGKSPSLVWDVVSRGGLPFVRCDFNDGEGGVFAAQLFREEELLDPIGRGYSLLSYLRHIVRQRSDKRTPRIEELIRKLESEEENGVAHGR